MTGEELVGALGSASGVTLHPGALEEDLAAVEQHFGIFVPEAHRALLLTSNGIEAQYGFLRLLGVGPLTGVDVRSWNDRDLWKFSWNPEILEYLCVGMTGWGSQLAYRLDDVKAPGADPLFYFFSHNFQSPGVSSLPFSRFLVQGFLANARTGMQRFDASVRRRFGDLAVDELVALSPSLMLGGTERLVNVAKLPAVTAMIANGDIWTETRKGDVSEVEHYVDEKGRGRIRLHFAADL